MLEYIPSPTVSAVDENHSPPAASAVADDVDNDDNGELKGAVGLNDVKRVGARRHLRHFKDSCRVKKRKVPRSTLRLTSLLPN